MTKQRILPFLAVILAAMLACSFYASGAYATVTAAINTQTPNSYAPYIFFSATTTNATSTNDTTKSGGMVITGAKQVILQFSRGGATSPNTGSSRFSVQVTPDGSNWYDYNQLRQVTDVYSSNTFDTRVGTSSITAATSTLTYALDTLGFYAVRAVVVETTDGEHTAKGYATF